MDTQNRTNESEGKRIERIRERTNEAVERTRESMAAGASGLAEASRDVAENAGEKLGRAAEIVRNAEPDEDLRNSVRGRTEQAMHSAGDGLGRAAPSIGRTAETAAAKTGAALHRVARPLSAILGAIAGRLGGWWKQASTQGQSLPAAEEEACRAHFSSLTEIPAGLTYESARPGYALGYLAGQNPAYRGRAFDEIEMDLRTGFGGQEADEYEGLREFVRFGYGRTAI